MKKFVKKPRETKVKICDSRKRVVASVTEDDYRNNGVNHLFYDRETGFLSIRHSGETLTISGYVRGDLTIRGSVIPSRIKAGGSVVMTGLVA